MKFLSENNKFSSERDGHFKLMSFPSHLRFHKMQSKYYICPCPVPEMLGQLLYLGKRTVCLGFIINPSLTLALGP